MLKNTKGFSLIELMVTIGIIGILSLIALPMYSSYIIRIKHTQLMTHALEISKRIEIELNSGSDLASSVADLFCEPGSIDLDKNSIQTTIKCAQNGNFRPPEGSLPPGGVPQRLNIRQDNSSFTMDGAIEYSSIDMYRLEFTIQNGSAMIIVIDLRGSRGGTIAKFYSTTTQEDSIFFRILTMYKGPYVTLYDKELNKKQPHSGWYCGFHTVYTSITPLPMSSEMPITCKHMVMGEIFERNPIFQEI